MKRLSLFYMLSFIPYAAVLSVLAVFGSLTMTAEILLMIFGALSAGALIYQLIYIIKLGRKDNISAGKSIGQFFMYLLSSISLMVIVYYIDAFFNGVSTYIFGGSVVYGMEAVGYLNGYLTYIPLIITAVYISLYFIIIKVKKHSNKGVKL